MKQEGAMTPSHVNGKPELVWMGDGDKQIKVVKSRCQWQDVD